MGNRPPMALVLDLDETLWRCNIKGVHGKRKLSQVDATVTIELRGRDGEVRHMECDISWRPGLAEFLDWIRKLRDKGMIEGPWIFSTGARPYVSAVLKELDPAGDLFGPRVLSKDACTATATPGFYLKDLAAVPSSGGLKRTILVDNNPVSCIIQPESCILVHDWLGDGEPDTELARVISVVEDAIANSVEGDYAGAIVRATEGHDDFKQNLANLLEVIDECPSPDETWAHLLKRGWAEVCAVKKGFIGPGPGCR